MQTEATQLLEEFDNKCQSAFLGPRHQPARKLVRNKVIQRLCRITKSEASEIKVIQPLQNRKRSKNTYCGVYEVNGLRFQITAKTRLSNYNSWRSDISVYYINNRFDQPFNGFMREVKNHYTLKQALKEEERRAKKTSVDVETEAVASMVGAVIAWSWLAAVILMGAPSAMSTLGLVTFAVSCIFLAAFAYLSQPLAKEMIRAALPVGKRSAYDQAVQQGIKVSDDGSDLLDDTQIATTREAQA